MRLPRSAGCGRREAGAEHSLFFRQAWAAHLGEVDLAVALLQENPDGWALWMPHNAPVRRRPEFKQILDEIGLVDYFREFGWNDFCKPVGTNDFECR